MESFKFVAMANEAIHIPSEQNLDYQMVAHIVEGLKKEQKTLARLNSRIKAKTELRMLTFWRWVGLSCAHPRRKKQIKV